MDIVAVLTEVVKAQEAGIRRLESRLDATMVKYRVTASNSY